MSCDFFHMILHFEEEQFPTFAFLSLDSVCIKTDGFLKIFELQNKGEKNAMIYLNSQIYWLCQIVWLFTFSFGKYHFIEM